MLTSLHESSVESAYKLRPPSQRKTPRDVDAVGLCRTSCDRNDSPADGGVRSPYQIEQLSRSTDCRRSGDAGAHQNHPQSVSQEKKALPAVNQLARTRCGSNSQARSAFPEKDALPVARA